MKLESAEIVRGVLPLKSSFETSLGAQDDREFILVHVFTSDGEGWGECVAPSRPFYSAEFIDSAAIVLRELLLPAVMAQDHITAADLTALLRPIRGHRMAKSAVEMAVLDAQLQQAEMSFADYLGATTTSVPSGVSVGIQPDLDRLIATVGGFIADGYVRIKLKIKPGWDIDPLTAVRESFGDSLPLQVDANAAYSLSDARHLAKLDRFDLLMVEQPLGADDLTEHARLSTLMDTPICLDESVTSAKSAADALRLGACSVINIKPGRVGGYLEARRIHDVCLANGVPVWCGGMLETGLGRAANLALAALPGFTLPGDISGSDRYYAQDLTDPIEMHDGRLAVPVGPGVGIRVLDDVIDRVASSRQVLYA